jgi:hypothetical protein
MTSPHPYTPTDILNDPDYQDGIAIHFVSASNVYKKYLGHWRNVYLNEQILFEAIASCYCDVYRLQVFRGIMHEDSHKRAAFLMKWICKFRPIQISTNNYINAPAIILANEIFAVEVALTILNINSDDFFRNSRLNGYAKNLVYLLRFHSCGDEQLASELFLFERYAKTAWSAMQ